MQHDEAARRVAAQLMAARAGYAPPEAAAAAATSSLGETLGSIIIEALALPYHAAKDILQNYRPGRENEPLNMDIGRRAFEAGPMALSPGAIRAGVSAGGELGVTATRLLQRTDAQKLIREMRKEGRSAREIAEALNERFAPILDEGAEVVPRHLWDKGKKIEFGSLGGAESKQALGVTADDVERMLEMQAGQRDIEFGALGGRERQIGRPITVEDVLSIADDLGLVVERSTASTGTVYLKLRDPKGPRDPGTPEKTKSIEVRIPAADDPHAGRSRKWRLDTYAADKREPTLSQMNIAGEAYQDNLPALRERIEYIFGKQKLAREAPTIDVPDGGPINDPRQMRLLSSGVPVYRDDDPSAWEAFPRAQP